MAPGTHTAIIFASSNLDWPPPRAIDAEHWRVQAWGPDTEPTHVAAPMRTPVREYQCRRC